MSMVGNGFLACVTSFQNQEDDTFLPKKQMAKLFSIASWYEFFCNSHI